MLVKSQRHSVRLGKMPKKMAESIKLRIEELIQYKILGVPYTAEFSQWLRDIEKPLHQKLVNAGLLDEKIERTLGEFLDQYVAMHRHNVTLATLKIWGHAIRNLNDFFRNRHADPENHRRTGRSMGKLAPRT